MLSFFKLVFKPELSTPEQIEKDFIYEGGEERLAKLGTKLKQHAEQRQLEYQRISDDLIKQFENIDEQLKAAAQIGRPVEMGIERWQWNKPDDSERKNILNSITQELQKRVKPGVTLDSFCPQFECYNGQITCLSRPGGVRRPKSDCTELRCWIVAKMGS